MNLTEKIDMLHGWDGPYVGNVIANERLGIPALNLNDGPQVWMGVELMSLCLRPSGCLSLSMPVLCCIDVVYWSHALCRASATTPFPARQRSGRLG